MDKTPTLLVREKLAVFVVFIILSTIASLSYSAKNQKLSQIKQSLIVHCVGAVKSDSFVTLPVGSQVTDLLAHIELADDADLTKLVLETRLKNDQVVVIPKKGALSLYVTGAVTQSGVVCVPEGLRYSQLRDYLTLTSEADVAIFKRRRRVLSEGETIDVSKRSEICVRK